VIFGSGTRRLANTSYFAIPGIEGETLLIALDRAGFAVASGSACASGSTEPSAVLLAMGVEPELAKGAIRVSLGRGNSMQQIEEFVRVLQAELERLRALSAVAVM
jgi:cysteine desulfurase